MAEKYKESHPKRIIFNMLYFITIGIIIIINIISYSQVKKFDMANKWVVHTYQVMRASNNILLNLLAAESNTRAYLITGEKFFIESIQEKIIEVDKNLLIGKNLTKDNVVQRQHYIKLKLLLTERFKILNQSIEAKKSNQMASLKDSRLLFRGAAITSQIETILNEILQSEEMLLKYRNYEALRELDSIAWVLFIASIMNILLLLFMISLFNIQFTKRLKSERKQHESENLLFGIIDGTKDLIAALDLNYNFIALNRSFEEEFRKIFGKRVELGMNLNDLLAHLPEEHKKVRAIWGKALRGEEFTTIAEFGDPAIVSRQYEISFSGIYDKEGELIGASHIMRNIEKRLLEENNIMREKAKLEEAFVELKQHDNEISLLNKMIMILQTTSTLDEALLLTANHCQNLLPFTSGIIYLKNPSGNYFEAMSEWNKPVSRERVFSPEQCWSLRQGKIYVFINEKEDIPCKHVMNQHDILPYICLPLLAQNEIIGSLFIEFKDTENMTENELNHLVDSHKLIINSVASQISPCIANIKLREALKLRSIRDSLTGLYNRFYLNEFLNRDLQRAFRNKSTLALVMCDLDHFKMINDKYGHPAGDYVLQKISALLQEQVRESDIVCRYGGEEFLIVLYETNKKEAYEKIEKIRIEISKLFFEFENKIIDPLTASFGIAIYPTDAFDSLTLIEAADKALYHAKKTGRNKVLCCDTRL